MCSQHNELIAYKLVLGKDVQINNYKLMYSQHNELIAYKLVLGKDVQINN